MPRNLILALIVVAVILLQALGPFAHASSHETSLPRAPGDLVEYWASARLLLEGKNPYSPEQMLLLQRTVAPYRHQPLLTWNPPWTLTFTAPFGLMNFVTAHFLWLLMSAACLVFSSPYLWRIYGGDPGKSRIAWLVCFAVVPTYLVLFLKQITPLLLLGVVGFLYFQERKQWFRAGLSLTLLSIKPHLAYLFWLALLGWVVEKRQWRVAYGAVTGVVAATVIPLLLVPEIFSYYVQQYSTTLVPKPLDWQTPTLSSALAHVIGPDKRWIRPIPALVTCIWFIFYWRKHRTRWDWVEQMPLLLLASQATAIFAWPFDQILLLPALMEAAVWVAKGGTGRVVRGVVLGFMLINLGPVIVALTDPNYFWLFWMVPLYLLIYVRLKRQEGGVEKPLDLR